jgi:hypothetical protein
MSKKVRPSRMVFVVLAAVIVTGGTGYALWCYFGGPNTSRFEPLLEDIRAQRLADNGHGEIVLTGTYQDLCPYGRVYVTHRPDGSLLVLFPTYTGKGFSLAGLLYTSRPMTEDDTHAMPNSVNLDHRYIAVGSFHSVSIDQRLNEHWYRASVGEN